MGSLHGAAIALPVLTILVSFSASASVRPSPGCKLSAATHRLTGMVEKHVHVADFEPVVRTYWVMAAPQPANPAPLLLAFHGQSGDAASFGASHDFSSLGQHQNLMSVFPQGMNDSFPGEEQGTGWNVGSAGNNQTCVPAGVGDSYGCYKSCRSLKKCGRCNWSTCYDDVLFVRTLLHAVSQEFCIDLDRVYAQGESNGAELLQHAVRGLPGTFAAVATWFGTPLLGFLLGGRLQLGAEQAELSRTAYLSLHGRNDTTIPPLGGVTDGGWIFEPLEQSTGIWSALHKCNMAATPIITRWDGGPLNFQCAEYKHCSTGRRVVQCMYDGVHGDWPTGTDGDEITLWFMFQFSRNKPVAMANEFVNIV